MTNPEAIALLRASLDATKCPMCCQSDGTSSNDPSDTPQAVAPKYPKCRYCKSTRKCSQGTFARVILAGREPRCVSLWLRGKSPIPPRVVAFLQSRTKQAASFP